MLRSLRRSTEAVIDLSVVLMIGITFAALMVVGYLAWTLKDQLVPTAKSNITTDHYNYTFNSIQNVTRGFDNAVNLFLVAVTIFILAVAISALLLLRGRGQ